MQIEEKESRPAVTPTEPVSEPLTPDRKSTRLNSSHSQISYAVFCLKKKKIHHFRHGRAAGSCWSRSRSWRRVVLGANLPGLPGGGACRRTSNPAAPQPAPHLPTVDA